MLPGRISSLEIVMKGIQKKPHSCVPPASGGMWWKSSSRTSH